MWFDPKMKENPKLVNFNEMKSAPRDGSWMLLDVDRGAKDMTLYPWSDVFVGRWNPKSFPDIGPHQYEWEVINRTPDLYPDEPYAGEVTTHYSAGRVSGWLPMP